MSQSAPPFPSAEEGLRLHQRLCQIDPLATTAVCVAFLSPLLAFLERTFSEADEH
jgi:hypothetical protein